MRTQLLGLAILGTASSVAAQSLLQQLGEVVQASGQSVAALPGVTIDVSAATSIPVMDLHGNILWRAKLVGSGITLNTNDQALFHGRTGNDLTMLLQRGAADPSGTLGAGVTVNYSSTQWDSPRLSPAGGFVMFGSALAGTGITTSNDSCVYLGPVGGPLGVLFREGDPAPGLPGATFTGTASGAQNVTALNSSGFAVVKGKVIGGGTTVGLDDDGWLSGVPGALQWICRENDLLPGGALAVASTLGGFGPQIDDLGRVLFAQALSTTNGSTPATAADDAALMLYTPGSGLSLVIREGDPAPGSGGCLYGGSIAAGSGPSNQGFSRQNGHVVFMNSMTGDDVTGATNDAALFAGQVGGSFTRVAREGEPAPTGVPGETYQALFPNGNGYQINDDGTVAFIALIGPTSAPTTNPTDTGVFLAKPPYGPGDVQLIVREGSTAAGLPAGWFISNTSGGGMSATATNVMISDRDTVLFNVAGVGDPTQANWGVPALIAWDAQHGARATFVQGDTFTVNSAPWVTTAAAGIVSTANGDGSSLGFNSNGDVCVKLFAGSQNAIVRGHVGSMVAEPASVAVAGGMPQNFHVDCGPAHAGMLYLVLASGLGTRPGFPSPLGAQNVPLNFDPLWTMLSINAANSPLWVNTLGFLDANGKGIGPSSFVMPAGFPSFLGATVHHAALVIDGTLTSQFVTEPSALRFY